VDSLALQLCLNASRDGQTVRFAGDFHLANVQLGRTNPGKREASRILPVRAPGDNLVLEGYGGTLQAPALRDFPRRPNPLGPVRLPGTPRVLSIEQQVVLITNRLRAMYDGHLRGKGPVVTPDGGTAFYRFHCKGDKIEFDGSWVVLGETIVQFANAFGSGLNYVKTLDMGAAAAALRAWGVKFNAHLTGVSQSGVPAHQGASSLMPMPAVPAGESRPAVLLDLVYTLLKLFVAHVCDGAAHAAEVAGGTLLPNPDPASVLMRRIAETEPMLTTGQWTGLTDARLRLEGLDLVGPLAEILSLNASLPSWRQLPFRPLLFEHAHGLDVGTRQPGDGGSGGGRLAVEVHDCTFEGFLGDGVSVRSTTDFVGRNIRVRECVRASLASVSGSSSVHLRNFTVVNDPLLGLGSTLDLEQDSNGVQPDNTTTASIAFDVGNVALLGGARVDLTAWTGQVSGDQPSLVQLSNVVCDRGSLWATFGGDLKDVRPLGGVDFRVRNCHFGGANGVNPHLNSPGRLHLTGCTFEPYDIPPAELASLDKRDPDPARAMPWSAIWLALGLNGHDFPALVELSGCAFLLSDQARARPGWWSAIRLQANATGATSALVLRSCTIAAAYDFGVQNPTFRQSDDLGGDVTTEQGGTVVARHLINHARLPFNFQNDSGKTSLDIDLDGIETLRPGARGWPALRLRMQAGDRLTTRNWWSRPEPVEFDNATDVLGIQPWPDGATWQHQNAPLGGRSLYGTMPILNRSHAFLGGYLFTRFYIPPGLAGDTYTWSPPLPAVKLPLVVAWRCLSTGNGYDGVDRPHRSDLALWVPLRALLPNEPA